MVLGGTSSDIAELRKQIVSDIKDRSFDEEDVFAVHLALEEAFLNAVKHGNKMDLHKEVKIDYFVSEEKVEISMADEGEGFVPDEVPDPRRGENLYKTAGRGLFLMHAYMDIVEYNKRGNRVRMVRYKEKPLLANTKTTNREIGETTGA